MEFSIAAASIVRDVLFLLVVITALLLIGVVLGALYRWYTRRQTARFSSQVLDALAQDFSVSNLSAAFAAERSIADKAAGTLLRSVDWDTACSLLLRLLKDASVSRTAKRRAISCFLQLGPRAQAAIPILDALLEKEKARFFLFRDTRLIRAIEDALNVLR